MVHVPQELGRIHTTDLTNIGYANQQKQKQGLGEQPRLMPAPEWLGHLQKEELLVTNSKGA